MKKLVIIVVTVVVLYTLYYLISPAFIVREVDDAPPVGIAGSDESAQTDPPPTSFPITGTARYPASGAVRLLDTPDGQVIRFEDFETVNGPRVHLYLSTDTDATDFIDLGPIRGTAGNINYEVPNGVDLSKYKYVLHWCVPFGVLFNSARLQ